jgi:methyl-accepting chemotaxis protein
MAAHLAGYRLHVHPLSIASGGHLVAYAPVLALPSWGVVLEQPRDAVVDGPRRLATRLAAVGLLALGLSAAVAWWDVRRVVRPLNHLTGAAGRFAAGELDQPVHVEHLGRVDELGVLARAFETMRRRLRASLSEIATWNRELEGRVAARTAEVESRSQELAALNERLQVRERERAELLQRLMAGQEDERRRLAQELHDETS